MEYTGIFQGGGMKGIAYIGALLALEENGYYCKRAAGSSIGAVFAGLLASGYKATELLKIIDRFDFSKLVKKENSKIKGILFDKGMYSLVNIENEIAYLLSLKGVYTFSDLEYKNSTILKVTGTMLGTNKTIIFPDNLPLFGINPRLFNVAKAITMSASFPIYFKPFKLINNYILDGGITNNFPFEVFDYNQDDIVIGFKIIDNEKKYIPSFINIININTKGTKVLNFQISTEEKIKLIEKGYVEGLKMVTRLNQIYKQN